MLPEKPPTVAIDISAIVSLFLPFRSKVVTGYVRRNLLRQPYNVCPRPATADPIGVRCCVVTVPRARCIIVPPPIPAFSAMLVN